MFNGMNGLEILKNWPRYESGELVGFGDEASRLGEDFKIHVVCLYSDGSYALNFNVYLKGERVKRPAVPAADGEPLEVRQTVWRIDTGAEYWVKSGQTITSDAVVIIRKTDCDCESEIVKASQLTHQRPALDAEGNRIEPAMDVWWVCEGDERGIHAEKLHVESIGEDGLVTCAPFNGGTWVELEPSELYVKKPALDADGVLCREGDEVWEVRSHRRREIVGTHYLDYETGEPLILCDGDDAVPIPATCVTHTNPEPPDSWEKIEEDKGLNPFDYCKKVGHKLFTFDNAEEYKSSDLVRRCRALAERGQ